MRANTTTTTDTRVVVVKNRASSKPFEHSGSTAAVPHVMYHKQEILLSTVLLSLSDILWVDIESLSSTRKLERLSGIVTA